MRAREPGGLYGLSQDKSAQKQEKEADKDENRGKRTRDAAIFGIYTVPGSKIL